MGLSTILNEHIYLQVRHNSICMTLADYADPVQHSIVVPVGLQVSRRRSPSGYMAILPRPPL